jgi:hypothetical protein
MSIRRKSRLRRRRPGKLFNWLRALDRRVKSLVEAGKIGDWRTAFAQESCRLFLMTRYSFRSGPMPSKVVEDTILTELLRLQGSKNGPSILKDLSYKQQQQLGALLWDIQEALTSYESHQQSAREIRKLAREVPGREEKLRTKLDKIRSALYDLLALAYESNPTVGHEYVLKARKCLGVLSVLNIGGMAGKYFQGLRDELQEFHEPKSRGLVQLYWFFRYEARFSGVESEIRAAMIANDILHLNLQYRIKYRAEARGCQGVRRAVERYRPRTAE